MPGFPPVTPWWYHWLHSLCNGLSHDGVGVVASVCRRYSVSGLGYSLPPCPPSGPTVPAYRGHPPPDALCCSAPFSAGHGLVAPMPPSPVGMHLDVAGVYHQLLKVRVINDVVQEAGPDAPVPPAAKAAMGILPIPVFRGRSRQGAPVRNIQNTAFKNRRLS